MVRCWEERRRCCSTVVSSLPLIRLLFFATFCFQFLTSLKRYFCGLVYVELRCLTLFRDMAATFKVAYLPLGC